MLSFRVVKYQVLDNTNVFARNVTTQTIQSSTTDDAVAVKVKNVDSQQGVLFEDLSFSVTCIGSGEGSSAPGIPDDLQGVYNNSTTKEIQVEVKEPVIFRGSGSGPLERVFEIRDNAQTTHVRL
jgi:hypothetical protein